MIKEEKLEKEEDGGGQACTVKKKIDKWTLFQQFLDIFPAISGLESLWLFDRLFLDDCRKQNGSP